MESTALQMAMAKSDSSLYYKLGIHTLGLVLRSGITITNPDPKADAKLQVPSAVHYGGNMKVIVVRLIWRMNPDTSLTVSRLGSPAQAQ